MQTGVAYCLKKKGKCKLQPRPGTELALNYTSGNTSCGWKHTRSTSKEREAAPSRPACTSTIPEGKGRNTMADLVYVFKTASSKEMKAQLVGR